MKTLALVFSRLLDPTDPLMRLGQKKPIYFEFLKVCAEKGFKVVVASSRSYQGDGLFGEYWDVDYENQSCHKQSGSINVDIVYDRTAGQAFPPSDESIIVVDSKEFKKLCWNKWSMYELLEQYMPQTYYIQNKSEIPEVLTKIKGETVVLKPHNGLKGRGIYIGPKDGALDFSFKKSGFPYLAQEFIETEGGIEGIAPTGRKHDLRIVMINQKIVWSHVRVPRQGEMLANMTKEGGYLKEVLPEVIPEIVRKTALEIGAVLYEKYNNPLFSLDFAMQGGQLFLLEINDQIGFPREDMVGKDVFIEELASNLATKAGL